MLNVQNFNKKYWKLFEGIKKGGIKKGPFLLIFVTVRAKFNFRARDTIIKLKPISRVNFLWFDLLIPEYLVHMGVCRKYISYTYMWTILVHAWHPLIIINTKLTFHGTNVSKIITYNYKQGWWFLMSYNFKCHCHARPSAMTGYDKSITSFNINEFHLVGKFYNTNIE